MAGREPFGVSRDVGALVAARLPYRVGEVTARWCAFVAGLLAVFGVGLYAYSRQLAEGLVVTGLRDIGAMGGSAWGLYIALDIYFVGVSFTGITVAALIRLLNLNHLKPVSRMAELLTVISLFLAGLSVIADLGQPLRGIVYLFRYARPQSPFFGTFTLVVAGYLFASLVYLYLDARPDAARCSLTPSPLQRFHRVLAAGYRGTPGEKERHDRASFWLAVAIVPLLVTAHSTLGFVFGLQVGRPGWHSALQAPAFVVMAGVSGVGALIVVAAIMRRVLGERERLGPEVFRWLGNLLMILLAVYLYFTLVEWLTTAYAAPRHEANALRAILAGRYAPVYWASIAALVLPFGLLAGQFFLRRHSLALTVMSGLLVNVAALGKRYLIVVPSQTHGMLLPYAEGTYTPTWVEYAVMAGLFALGTLLYAVAAKIFPIMEVPEPHEPAVHAASATATRPRGVGRRLRSLVTLAMVAGGFALQAVSYFRFAAPLGAPTSPVFSDPRVPWAPTLFIVGVMLVFLAAVTYELLPARDEG